MPPKRFQKFSTEKQRRFQVRWLDQQSSPSYTNYVFFVLGAGIVAALFGIGYFSLDEFKNLDWLAVTLAVAIVAAENFFPAQWDPKLGIHVT